MKPNDQPKMNRNGNKDQKNQVRKDKGQSSDNGHLEFEDHVTTQKMQEIINGMLKYNTDLIALQKIS